MLILPVFSGQKNIKGNVLIIALINIENIDWLIIYSA